MATAGSESREGSWTMATREEEEKRLIEAGLAALSEKEAEDAREAAERQRIFEELVRRIEQPGLQDRILERYQAMGRTLLADTLPGRVDPTIARALRPILGDVSDVRVHTGKVASDAAAAMEARAFAIGDKDIFIDRQQFDPNTQEGASLLAHEIAHTRDAATGFALSKRHGSDSSSREAFAHEVEFKFARELEEKKDGSIVAEMEDASAGLAPDGSRKEPEVDKNVLAEKVLQILEKQTQRHGERHGRW
jgi:hypothetical protein